MNTTLWIIQWTLAVLIFFFGLIKIRHQYETPQKNLRARIWGVLGCLMAIGLIFPVFTSAYPLVVPISASLLFISQVIGIFTSDEKIKWSSVVFSLVILLLFGLIIYVRFFDYLLIDR